MKVPFVLCLLSVLTIAKDLQTKLDRLIIACRTTDFECFKKQYRLLRDQVLMGNDLFSIPSYEPYTFKYGNGGTCIRLMGIEDSELTSLQLNSITKELVWNLQLPFRLDEVNKTEKCVKLDRVFEVEPYSGPLRKFLGNASIQVTYPYRLKKKKSEVMMVLQDENLDVILDIPDLSHYNNSNEFERNLFDMSEWAYSVVQHIDAAQHFALPYTSQLRTVMELVPLRRFILLYPDEEFADLQFKFVAGDANSKAKCY